MNKNRLLKVAEFLDALHEKEKLTKHKVFDFKDVACSDGSDLDMLCENKINKNNIMEHGSVFCACGLLPVIDPDSGIHWIYCDNDDDEIVELNFDMRFDIRDESGSVGYVEVASNYFNISYDEACWLFTPHRQQYFDGWGEANVCGKNATAKEVADAIRHFIEIKEQAA